MSKQTKENEQYAQAQQMSYIEHEVTLRLHDHKFQLLEKAIERLDNKIDSGLKHLDNKMTWGFGVFIAISIVGWIIPIALQFVHVRT